MYTDFVFDLNVVFQENHNIAVKYLNKVKLVKYTARGKTPKALRKEYENHLLALEGKGRKKPLILEKWLVGEYTWKQCHDLVTKSIERKISEKPKSTTLALLRDISVMTFNPDILKVIIVVDENVKKVIKKLHQSGKRIYLCGNMDGRTFSMLRNLHRDLFDMVIDSFVSGEVGILKPSIKYYEKMVEKFGLNPFRTYIVDCDEQDIIDANTIGFKCGKVKDIPF